MTYHPVAARGIFAATPSPLTREYEIDEPELAALAKRLSETEGIVGFLLNGHAGENVTMPARMQLRTVEVVRAAVPTARIVAGINAEGSGAAAALAEGLETAGANALMVFPPNGWALYQERDMVLAHHLAVLEASALPVMLFQASIAAGGMAYPAETLAALCDLPRVVGIKEGSWEVNAYEATRRLVKARRPDVAVYGSGDEHLFTSYAIGSVGSLVSLAAVAPEAIAALFAAVEAGDLNTARAAHDRIYPLARAIYGTAPGGRANARLKTCLALLGAFSSDRMIPPVPATAPEEHAMLRTALSDAGLLHAAKSVVIGERVGNKGFR